MSKHVYGMNSDRAKYSNISDSHTTIQKWNDIQSSLLWQPEKIFMWNETVYYDYRIDYHHKSRVFGVATGMDAALPTGKFFWNKRG